MSSASLAFDLRLGNRLPDEVIRRVERVLRLQHGKWDTRVDGGGVLSPQPLLMGQAAWDGLCAQTEQAARELFQFEEEISFSSRLQELVGIPRILRKFLPGCVREAGLRTLRFDFHPTSEGWRLSEVNSDVPGGFIEASVLPQLFRPFQPGTLAPPDPLRTWGGRMQRELREGHIALLHAPGYLEDVQVVLALARELGSQGFHTHILQSPESLRWAGGRARLAHDRNVDLAAVIRFYQAEWLAELPRSTGWRELFRGGGATRVLNPARAVISESKRLPLSWPYLQSDTAAWRRLLPACLDPRELGEAMRQDWVLKAAYANTGDRVHLGSELSQASWNQLLRVARKGPGGWVAQRRFETIAFPSRLGMLRPCVGIYVMAGQVTGAYVRFSRTQVTDAHALEAPLLLVPQGD